MRIWTTSRDELKHVRTVMMCAAYFGGRRAKMELKSGDVAVGVIVSTNFGQRSRPPDGEGEVYEIKADGDSATVLCLVVSTRKGTIEGTEHSIWRGSQVRDTWIGAPGGWKRRRHEKLPVNERMVDGHPIP